MTVLKRSEDQAFITAQVPSRLREGLEQSARENDRSLSAELRRAVSEYLVGSHPGGSRTASAAVEARRRRGSKDGS